MRARLEAAPIGRLATVRPDGRPHLVPCCFAVVGETVFSAVDAKPKSTLALQRLANIRSQPSVTVLVDHYAADWSTLWWVRVDGRAGHRRRHRPHRGARGAAGEIRAVPGDTATRSRDRDHDRVVARMAVACANGAQRPARGVAATREAKRPMDKERTMKYRRLGRTALRVSELCLGTMNFGPLTTEDDAFVIMDRALELGINFFDTANGYGGDKGPGATETIVGQLVRAGRRPAREGRARDEGVRPDERLAERRRALGPPHPRRVRREPAPPADRPHRPLPDAPRRPRARRGTRSGRRWRRSSTQGKVIYVGSSNFAGWHIAQANEAAKHRNFLGLVSEQSLYNLASRTVELEVLPACRGVRPRRDPVEPARGRAARRHASRTATPARRKNVQPALRSDRARSSNSWEKFCDRARRGAGGRRARVAAAPEGRDRADHRPAHARAARRRVAARDRDRARRGRAEGARRRSSPARADGARGLRLVT